jgi:hypothetical protein
MLFFKSIQRRLRACSTFVANLKPLIASLVLLTASLYGSDATANQSGLAVNPDVKTIDSILEAYYDVVSGPAGSTVDVSRDSMLHHPDAWIAISYIDERGKPQVSVTSLLEFHGENSPRKEGFYERETKRIVQRHGNMAHVWSHKEVSATPEGKAHTKGVNNITLFHDGTRWWIMGWMIDNTK